MEKVTGRTDDMIILRGVNVFPTQIEEILLSAPGLAPHFQLVLARRGRMDAMTVRVEARPDCSPERRAALARDVVTAVKSHIGVTVAVEVIDPDTLERSLGKLQRVVDQRR
jgi:phenylacetate-CoA ligase